MMLSDYKLEMFWESGCCAAWQNAVAELSEDIGEVLPHLQSALKESIYDPGQRVLRLRKEGAEICIHPKRIDVTYLQSEAEARALVDWLKDMINETYGRLKGN